ncbi:high mobility group B protein 7 isoform X2 [Tripterygium wilfordii]|uniref:high mobility group B protein 7 isoform X2 n=1 Tax=Tripterygium wilfordii TaxID=458696 RepID=UPI0018F830E7|nr:high mobility group B protein 7 isoform X2 [Tripterygium wilfordii]
MGIPRPRKRVRAIRRAPDGSAFQPCDGCGISVAVALADMHECETEKEEVKRFKGVCAKQNVIDQSCNDQPRSAFRLFMESFVNICSKHGKFIDIDQCGFESWKNMSEEERQPYVYEAEVVNEANTKALRLEEIAYMIKGNSTDADSLGVPMKIFLDGSSSY